jgi:hypothetical protein
LGFSVSATAVQRNTEAIGERIPDNPYAMISAQRGSDRMSSWWCKSTVPSALKSWKRRG